MTIIFDLENCPNDSFQNTNGYLSTCEFDQETCWYSPTRILRYRANKQAFWPHLASKFLSLTVFSWGFKNLHLSKQNPQGFRLVKILKDWGFMYICRYECELLGYTNPKWGILKSINFSWISHLLLNVLIKARLCRGSKN